MITILLKIAKISEINHSICLFLLFPASTYLYVLFYMFTIIIYHFQPIRTQHYPHKVCPKGPYTFFRFSEFVLFTIPWPKQAIKFSKAWIKTLYFGAVFNFKHCNTNFVLLTSKLRWLEHFCYHNHWWILSASFSWKQEFCTVYYTH